MSAEPVTPSLAVSLNLAAAELADLMLLADGLQALVARIAARHGCADLDLIREGQSADLLSQRLAGVSLFLSALADTVPEDVSADVLAAIKDLTLAAQARRLCTPFPAEQDGADADGEAVFFGN
jgi:hypothetical protein